ncbi:glycosyltransferase family 4 protein [Parabacteroides sp. APC149_11_2_Y6]
MKILVLSSHTFSLFWFRIDMMKSFIRLGHDVIAAGPDDESLWRAKFESMNIKYVQIEVSRNGLNPLNDIKTFLCLNRLLKQEKPDKVFAYQAKTIVYGCLAAKKNKIKEVYPMVAGLGSIFRGTGVKNTLTKIVMQTLYQLAFACSENVFFQNKDDRNELVQHRLLDESKTVLINGSGVNLEKFKPSSLPAIPTFLYIGRLIRDKGIMEYLDACKQIKIHYPDVRCLLVGPFDSNPSALKPEELQPYIDKNIIEYYGEQSDVRPYIVQCSTYVLPSYHEGTPKTVLESMAMGRAILTSDAPGCRETVIDGKNGFLIPVKDVSTLVQKMKFMILHQDLNAQMGKASYEIAVDKYDVKKVNHCIMKTMRLIK